MRIIDYISEWGRHYEVIKAKNLVLPDGVLAYRLFKSRNVGEEKKDTIINLTLDNMKKQLKVVFDVAVSEKEGSGIKVEHSCEVHEDE